MAKINMKVNDNNDQIGLEMKKKLEEKRLKKASRQQKEKEMKKENGGLIKGIKEEMKKVTWPSRKYVIKYSIITIIMIILLAFFFLGISLLFDFIYGLVLGWIG